MARVIGGIGVSHTPTIGFARDRKDRGDPVWGGVYAGFEPVADWLAVKAPDALVFIYNDHVTSFFFDHYSAFALGIGNDYPVADEGGEPRDLPNVPGHAPLAHHISQSLVADEFDMSFFQERGLDHGCLSPLSMMLPFEDGWPVPIVPLQVGVLQLPMPSARRCHRLGKALRRAITSFPEDIDVAIVATGGLSHQVSGARAGFNNPDWDERFLDAIESDPEMLASMTHAEFATLGGMESVEVIMWLIMRGALSDAVTRVHRSYYLPSMTAIATIVLESGSDAADEPAAREAQLKRAGLQSKGLADLPGSLPFDHAISVDRYRINNFLHELIRPEFRRRFVSDPDLLFVQHGLLEIEVEMIRHRDWSAMIQYGVIFFLLEKLAAVVGLTNADVYAAMRGETVDDFQKSRNAPGAVYSVAGTAESDSRFRSGPR